eukprot:13855204-Ditylum_brightwellii.AAC.1
MATGSAAPLWFIHVQGIGMELKDHIGCIKINGGIRVRSAIVHQLMHSTFSCFSGIVLLQRDGV